MRDEGGGRRGDFIPPHPTHHHQVRTRALVFAAPARYRLLTRTSSSGSSNRSSTSTSRPAGPAEGAPLASISYDGERERGVGGGGGGGKRSLRRSYSGRWSATPLSLYLLQVPRRRRHDATVGQAVHGGLELVHVLWEGEKKSVRACGAKKKGERETRMIMQWGGRRAGARASQRGPRLQERITRTHHVLHGGKKTRLNAGRVCRCAREGKEKKGESRSCDSGSQKRCNDPPTLATFFFISRRRPRSLSYSHAPPPLKCHHLPQSSSSTLGPAGCCRVAPRPPPGARPAAPPSGEIRRALPARSGGR